MFHRYTVWLLLVISLAITSNCEEYHIVPLDSQQLCGNYQHAQTCLTINQLALDDRLLSISGGENITLSFLPGNHTLTEELRIRNKSNVHITGQDTFLRLNGNGSLELSMINELTIEGVTFTGGNIDYYNSSVALTINDIDNVFVVNCNFIDFKLPDQDGIIVIKGTTKVSIVGNNFRNNIATALYIEATEVHMKHCSFSGNTYYTARITSLSDTNLGIRNSINNIALRGGAVRVSGNTNITECTFLNNYAQYFGGAIFTKSGILTIVDSELRNNSCGKSGGAIFSGSSENVYIQRSELTYNSAITGGVMYTSSGEVFITSSELSHNRAASCGGAIYSNRFNRVFITNCTLTNNIASTASIGSCSGGGAIYTRDGGVIISKSELTENVANYGGAVLVSGGGLIVNNSMLKINYDAIYIGGTGRCSIIDSEFFNNSKSALTVKRLSRLLISNCTFSNNKGMRLENVRSVNISKGVFESNVAEERGGAINMKTINGTIFNCVLRSNHAGLEGGALFINNENTNKVVSISSTEFLHNSAPTGAAVFATRIKKTLFLKSDFINNAASSMDGAIISILDGTLIFERKTVIQNNTGPIYALSSRLEFTGPALLDNNRGELGGAIRAEESQVYLNSPDGITITNNKATTGGGLFLSGSDLFVQYPITISHNSAQDGGGIYASSSRLELRNTPRPTRFSYKESNPTISIFNNSARQSGGGIYASASSIVIKDTYLSLHSNMVEE